MEDFLATIAEIITVDIFIGFGLYSILYVLINFFKRNTTVLETMDLNACRFIVFTGAIYFLTIGAWMIMYIVTIDKSNTQPVEFRLVPWLQPLVWTMLTQLFWIKTIRHIKSLRFLIAILFILSFEKFVIITTSLHRDYLPKTWIMFRWMSSTEVILGLTTKIVIFCLLATLHALMAGRFKLILTRTKL